MKESETGKKPERKKEMNKSLQTQKAKRKRTHLMHTIELAMLEVAGCEYTYSFI